MDEQQSRICSRCGSAMVDGGALYAAMRVSFRPQYARFMTLQTGDVMTKALMCRDCGSIDIVGDVNKLRHLTGG